MDRKLSAIMAADVAGYSRMMSRDEGGTLAALKATRNELVFPVIDDHRGRIVKLIGDGILAEFPSVIDAVTCAAKIQDAMPERNADLPEDRRLAWRIGIHLGDVIIEGDDIYGDDVNIAARLEGIAEIGGICISRQVFDQVEGKVDLAFRALGPQNLKNIAKPVESYALTAKSDAAPAIDPATQEVRYCRASDGTRLAYATIGHGPPLVKTANWMLHLEYDLQVPGIRQIWLGLARNHTLIRYDSRGSGMSDWETEHVSVDAWVADLEAVVDAAGVDRFPLLGISQGSATAIAYAARHPERVSHLLLLGGYLSGRHRHKAKHEAMRTLIQTGWGSDNPTFRQLFTSQLMPDATKEEADAFNELERQTASAESAARFWEATGEIDVSAAAEKVTAPTLVMHARDDLIVSMQQGKAIAAVIPGARFVAFPGRNHIPVGDDPEIDRILEEIALFLKE
ncbi:MAG: alpha/beta fold hydrolase [Stellaceae bacterium]